MALASIKTTRYSTVVAAFVDRFPGAVATLDKKVQSGSTSAWCTNAALRSARNFTLRLGDDELLGFHDGPQNMWASTDTLALVQELADSHVLRFTVDPVRPPSLLRR